MFIKSSKMASNCDLFCPCHSEMKPWIKLKPTWVPTRYFKQCVICHILVSQRMDPWRQPLLLLGKSELSIYKLHPFTEANFHCFHTQIICKKN